MLDLADQSLQHDGVKVKARVLKITTATIILLMNTQYKKRSVIAKYKRDRKHIFMQNCCYQF